MGHEKTTKSVAVIIPCYREKARIIDVLEAIPHDIQQIYVVDDSCPDGSGEHVAAEAKDPRITILFNAENLGVGGATKAGYEAALADGHGIICKIDGDGQMDPRQLPSLIAPILAGTADYVKGNRFYELRFLKDMPAVRVFGNAILSFLTKLTTGYWSIMDPTNGYTAMHSYVLQNLPLAKVDNRYFFETDLLFRLNTLRAVVLDVPMRARYEDEQSGLSIVNTTLSFPAKHLRCLCKRIFYNYFLRGINIGSIELVAGSALLFFGVIFGSYVWATAAVSGVTTPAGTVMLAGLPTLLGFQLLVSAIQYDVSQEPTRPIHPYLVEYSGSET